MNSSPSDSGFVAIDRAIFELRRGRPVVITPQDSPPILAQAAETMTERTLSSIFNTSKLPPTLVITAVRGARLGFKKGNLEVLALNTISQMTVKDAHYLADPTLKKDFNINNFRVKELGCFHTNQVQRLVISRYLRKQYSNTV